MTLYFRNTNLVTASACFEKSVGERDNKPATLICLQGSQGPGALLFTALF